ncbi:amidohydrolase family protein [Microbulbifer halophilus]|uniref:Amidohydrolase family protein n=1 Tax=Microbulbifer halophilus TaxID=453963 RepID=A0ABW5EC61_9GAMM|nr:amidohydrolase family protein [Microbulbifer halophilus]MCW8124977.1 amidohydrolase family protein [Microbulbifer halophilus]
MKHNISAALAAALLTLSGSLHADTLEYVFYDKEGVAGGEIVERNGTEVSGQLKLGWNNRRLKLEESFHVDAQQMPQKLQISGISPFGAPVEEQFSIEGKTASWSGSDEQGSAEISSPHFYVPKNQTLALSAQLVRALLADDDQHVDLLPQGSASLHQLDELTLEQGDKKQTVYLYGVSGLSLTPELAWYDADGDLFASDSGGWFAILRKGWDKSHLEELKQRQVRAADAYLQKLATKHTHKSAAPILLEHVDLVDVEAGQLLPNRHLLIQGGKIRRISKTPIEAKKNATVIDAKGKTLIPGLWDMHGHLSLQDGALNMAAGVINVRDIGNTHENIMRVSEQFASDKVIGGKVYRAGFMDRESENAMRLGKTATSLEHAREIVDWYAERGYGQIKTYSSMEPEWIAPLAEHIHSRGMRLSGHIPAFMTAEQAVDAGFDEIQHINMLFLNFMGAIDTRKKLRFTEVGEHAHELDLDSPEVAAFLDKLAAKGTVVDATLTIFRSMLQRRAGQLDPEYTGIADHLPVNLRRRFVGAELDIQPQHRDDYHHSTAALLQMVRKLHEHKVRMVAGTDGLAGFTLLRELELYSESGIPNADVLRTATLEPARVVGAAKRTGSIDLGKDADLVLLDGNPLEDIRALRNTALVIEGQNLYKPDELYEALGIEPFYESLAFDLGKGSVIATK